jgi:hypothetical protein
MLRNIEPVFVNFQPLLNGRTIIKNKTSFIRQDRSACLVNQLQIFFEIKG